MGHDVRDEVHGRRRRLGRCYERRFVAAQSSPSPKSGEPIDAESGRDPSQDRIWAHFFSAVENDRDQIAR
jgi:hypothetical protein